MATNGTLSPGREGGEAFFQAGGAGTREARAAARRLARHGLIPTSEIDDVTQEIGIQILAASEWYDPSRGDPGGYFGRIARRAAIDIVRHRRADRREPHPVGQSREERDKSRGRSRPSTLTDVLADDCDRRRPARGPADRQSDLVHDVDEVTARLPTHLRELCEGLKYGTREEVARCAGIRPGTLDHHIQAIRRKFQEAGLSAYVRAC